MLGAGLGQFIMGPLADRFGRRKVVLTGILIYAVGSLLCILAPSMFFLIIGRLLQSLGSCAAIVIAYAVVRDVFSVEKSAKMYSILASMSMTAPIIAPLLGGALTTWFGSWRASFVFLLLFGVLSFISTFCLLDETLADDKRLSIKPSVIMRNMGLVIQDKSFRVSSFLCVNGIDDIIYFLWCISFSAG